MKKIVKKSGDDRYCKYFTVWQRFLNLLFAQISGKSSLREIKNTLPAGHVIFAGQQYPGKRRYFPAFRNTFIRKSRGGEQPFCYREEEFFFRIIAGVRPKQALNTLVR